ncbi:phosphatase PAP2 family protein [Methylobacterium planeticum]|uniref:Acid phosphatase n=2 Tax=Methylobacterium planeticum TaxID=2615211 RepID=A0A6N6MVM1_9HYPH|nr:phosphatase PAP2 family protein [Methylobacterium planeticum]KAB1075800.1 phosphatase PAP2 family protein [Methylobacterium planeticum]
MGREKSAPSVGADSLKPEKPAHQPYLADAAMPDTVAILPAPPASHSAAENADKVAFNATRALKGSPRWDLATADVAEGASAILDNFACVLGTRLDQVRVPALITLLERSRLDIARATRGPKVHYRRLRPFVGNDAPICVQRSQQLADSFSYPSGHATQGWAYALIMASLVPGKATAILTRGRAYGESRVICGVHWMSDVEAGRTNGAAIVAALQGDAGFRTDLERARQDLGRALAAGGPSPDQAVCAREEAAAKEPVL